MIYFVVIGSLVCLFVVFLKGRLIIVFKFEEGFRVVFILIVFMYIRCLFILVECLGVLGSRFGRLGE